MEAILTPRIRVPAKGYSLQKVRSFSKDVLRETLFGSPQLRRQLVLAIDEAVANVVEHGFKETPSGAGSTIEVSMEIHQDRIIIRILDQGKPFDPRIRPEAAVVLEEVVEEGKSGDCPATSDLRPQGNRTSSRCHRRGYGRHLIHLIMDSIEYTRTPQGENLLVLTKFLPRDEIA